ncbi:hypothetical protein HY634_00465 [Candidatus Uhrbacteria bacterium]|nr:hypothetical protein [Candidatus Uhrbacteria bacterium]
MNSILGFRVSILGFLRFIAHETLPILLILYPLLLLLDDLEPGFVRSVVNPHWFLVAMIVVGMIAGKDEPTPSRSPSERGGGSAPSSKREGEKRVWPFAIACIAAVVVGVWVAWRLHAGTLGIVVASLAAIAVGAIVLGSRDSESSS